jgi:hypothetical protein
MPLFCCPECFDDRGLRENIIPSLNPSRGVCNYCGSENVDLIEPIKLREWFELLINIYEPNERGKFLVEWMKSDWQLFTHERMDVPHAKNLLADILDNGEIVRKTFVPSSAYNSNELERWEALRTELMYENRYFPKTPIHASRLEQLLPYLKANELPTIWHRARIQVGDTPFSIENMGAPPKRLASHGRANPAGIPYLYLGSSPETAAAEVRPHTGETASVARFELLGIVHAIDLRRPARMISPFLLEDESQIGTMRLDLGFLERLGEELTRPVVPQGAPIDYVPSQYLCEFIKKCGYDGVIYRSSVSDGMNLALFNPAKARGLGVESFMINRVHVEIAPAIEAASEKLSRNEPQAKILPRIREFCGRFFMFIGR